MNKIDLSNVPNKPGIYIWKNINDEIIYVGKAKRLKQRMEQYFKGMLNSYKTSSLVDEIKSFDYIISPTEKEALILERNYIEKYFPKYNILLTDDKRYPYIKIELKDRLEISLVYRIRSLRNKNANLFGPYPPGHGASKMVKLIERISLYKDGLPFKGGDHEYWLKKYHEAKNILSTGQSKLINDLKAQMINASENQLYELAHELKETIKFLEISKEKQVVELNNNDNIDVIGIIKKDDYASISMIFYRSGSLLSKKEFIIEIVGNLEESMRQFLSQYYAKNIRPNTIISNIEVEHENISIPLKGKYKKILDISVENAKDNIELKLKEFIRKEELTIGSMTKLKNILKLNNLHHILMMDNSNTNNTLPVSVVVSYRNGIKQTKEYRKYNLVNVKRNADVEYMRQGIEKYFSKQENAIPDLFIVDGGIAQVNEAKKILNDIPIIGLVKNKDHKTEAIIDIKGNRIDIHDSNLLNFLRGMQDEVDRFAKYHHNQRRSIQTLEGSLIKVPGVGPRTEKKLLSKFKTYSSIYNATIEELEEVVSKQIASNIKENFNK